ncbi:TonB-dependent receptor [Halosquirtibacter laminarini]|uniref:TonB-dependent receptor n=1 Tax=Halosquirtibacter laminarini TaxID=3374600 RepID=A0AC61NQW7_9BACT|nr:TonB-dependent receptor [Prolixibacteraceae bacterium]
MKQVDQAWHRRLFIGTMLLLLSLVGGNVMAQKATIKGVVKDEKGVSLPGVTVLLKGTTVGTITDFEGNYTLNISDSKTAVIRYSYVGFVTQELVPSGKSVINITLKEDAISLGEVVAVGYGVMKKSDVTGSTVGVKSDDILKANTTTVNEALQGKMAGVTVTSNSGAPGGDIKIRVRGANSISGSNAPLVVIDGFVGGSLKELNPNDIASLEVLKDASATAIYGSRGSNGVILVTTKSGKKGDFKVSYNGYYGQQRVSKKLDVLDAASYAEVVNAKRVAFGKTNTYTQDQIDAFRKSGGHNWQDEIYTSAPVQNHNLSFTGGTDKMRFMFSGQYLNQDGIMKNSNYNRLNYRLNLDADLTDKLNFKVNISGFRSKDKKFNLKWPNGTPPTDALVFEPTLPIYDENGEYTESSFPTVNNPVADINELNKEATKTNATVNASLSYRITPKLILSVAGGYVMNSSNNYGFDNKYLYSGRGKEKGNASNSMNTLWQNTNTLSYINSFGDHNLNITLANEQSGSSGNKNSFSANDFFLNRGYYMLNLGAMSSNYKSSFTNQWALMSFLSRVNYSYKGKYLFTGSVRADGSSKFAKGNKWGYFPSASVAWRVSEESFMEDSEIINNFKLRLGVGQTGSQATDPYRSKSIMTPSGNYSLNGTDKYIGLSVAYPDSPDLSWETTTQSNIGADLTLWEGMISLTADYYYKKTSNILLYVNTAYVSGFSNELKNVGSLENKGVDLSLGLNLGKGDLKYNGTITATSNNQKILDLNGATEMPFIGASGLTSKIIVGRPSGEFYGYKYEGVWKSSQTAEAAVYGAKPGDPRFMDQNNDNTINTSDKTIIGNATPSWYFGFSNNVSYKNLDVSFMFTSTVGQDVFNYVRAKTMGVTNTDPVNPDILNRWTPENENTDIPGFGSTSKDNYQALSSMFIEDGSFIRLKNVTVGYTFNDNMLKGLGLSKLRVYGSIQNVFTLTNYTGYDPEVSNGTSDMMPGYDIAPYPSARVWNLGVNISF